jgi:hypothetical protein
MKLGQNNKSNESDLWLFLLFDHFYVRLEA